MREFDIVIRAEDGVYNPVDKSLIDDPDLSREGVEFFSLMPDGTVLLLYHITGDADKLETILEGEETALSYDIFEIEGDGLRATVHFAEDTLTTALITLKEAYDLVIDLPLVIDDEGGLHMRVAGDPDNIREAAMMRPETVDIQFEETDGEGANRIDTETLLTERQQEVLAAAIEKGYYEIPRQATNEEIAADMDCSTSTVGAHLRKIESRIISEVGPS
jgi:predicted DNA binding protein